MPKALNKIPSLGTISLIGASALGLGASQASAQAARPSQVEEVVVTAQKRAENIQDVPISITALSGTAIEKRGLGDIQDLARSVPNLELPSANNSRNIDLRIRGLGSSGSNPGIESSVGIFVDGLYLPIGGMAQGQLIDIQSFEVLRGPQGTLYGRNTPVGALNITTRKPQRDFESTIRAGAGEYNSYSINGFVGGGLTENTAGRLSFWYADRGGYFDNLATGEKTYDNNEWGLRGKLLFEPSDSLSVNLVGSYGQMKRNCCIPEQIDPLGPGGIASAGFLAAQAAAGYPFNNFNDHDQTVDGFDVGRDKTKSGSISATIDYRFSNDFILTAISGYQQYDNRIPQTAVGGLKNPILDQRQVLINEIRSQEIRIASPADNALTYLAGIYLYNQKTKFVIDATVLPGANRRFTAGGQTAVGSFRNTRYHLDIDSYAVFGNMTYKLNPKWDVTGGLRYSSDQKDANITHNAGNNIPGNRLLFTTNNIGDVDDRYSKVTWSANTRFRVTDDVMLFATAATGWKSGGFDSRGLNPGVAFAFGPETSINYEVGTKSTLLDRRLRANLTAYFTTVKDFQETQYDGLNFSVSNAGNREAKGVEGDLEFLPIDPLTLNLSFAYMDAQYTKFPNAQCGIGETPNPGKITCDRKGFTPAFSPKWQYTAGAEWARDLGGTDLQYRLRAEYSWRGKQNLIPVTLDFPANQGSVGLLNLNAGLGAKSGRWEVAAFVKNATNKAYFTFAVAQPLATVLAGSTASPSGAPPASTVGYYGAPREWGLRLTMKFGQ